MVGARISVSVSEEVSASIGNEWDMVSFWFATDTLVSTLEENGIELFKYNSATGYTKVQSTVEIERGRSYWSKSDFGANMSLEAQVYGTEQFNILLDDGWNMIGNPYSARVWMDDISVGGIPLSDPGAATGNTPAYYYGAGSYSIAEGAVDPGEGFWLYASGGATITFSEPSTPEIIADAGEDSRCIMGVYYDGERIGDVMVYSEHDVECVLDGSGSSGPGELQYEWTLVSGPETNISGATSSEASFVPSESGTYRFRLAVTSGENSNTDGVVINVVRISGKLVFHSSLEQDGTGQNIYVMNADGTGLTTLINTDGSDDWPRWSPDGESIVFMSDRGGELYNIYVMDASGENIVQLTDNGFHNGDPDWSVNGRILFRSKMDGMGDIYDIDPDIGISSMRRLTEMSQSNFRPRYSFDGEWIVTRVDYGGDNWEVAVMDKDGNSFTQITDGSTIKVSSTWTTDGRILFEEKEDWGISSDLMVIDRDGTDKAEWPKLKSTIEITDPVMTDDGKYIFYVNGTDEDYIHAMCSDGSCDSRIGVPGIFDYHPGTCAECSQ